MVRISKPIMGTILNLTVYGKDKEQAEIPNARSLTGMAAAACWRFPYLKDFTELAEEFPFFSFHLCLSRPREEDNWNGHVGHTHKILYDNYLKDHEAPEDVQESSLNRDLSRMPLYYLLRSGDTILIYFVPLT